MLSWAALYLARKCVHIALTLGLVSGFAHLPVHISNPNPNAMIQFFNKSFILCDQSWKKIIAVVKFYPFSTMDPSLKAQCANISAKISLLNLPINIQISQIGHNMLGRCIVLDVERDMKAPLKLARRLQTHVHEQKNFIAKKLYSISFPLSNEVKQQHNALKAPGLGPNFKEDLNDDDSSPFTFFMWIPIKQTTGNLVEDNFEVQGGEFIFLEYSCGICYDFRREG
ncbi:hypothetical protein VP01_1558g3 [Puccinia sorghi]|uniref:Tet-like 2OG-Fe(II) oxygenase domain-containing protein n=1 Tax=Puccinia sorghi TaxID=27349 RepID=A0A0L6VJW6_9BASI|nr:hypothetical protein VP01_1558g3 [Puccinia sorghi]